jgi:hypothetical protein
MLSQIEQEVQQERANLLNQVDSDAQKQQMAHWKILQDTQTKIFAITQEALTNKAQTQDAAYKKWEKYLRS